MKLISFLFVFLSAIELNYAQQFEECHGKVNTNGTLKWKYNEVDHVEHGKKYLLTNGTEQYTITLLNLTGTAYEQGFAMGKLIKSEIKFTTVEIYEYAVHFLEKFIPFLPEFMVKAIGTFVKTFARELNNICYFLRRKNIPQHFIDEMQGIADATEIDYMEIARINMIPEMLKAFCTLVSIWGPASKDEHVLLLRGLDWDPHAPMTKHPVITFYHHTGSYSFANIGFAGLIGSLVAMSANQIGIGEQLWGGTDGSRMSFTGEPWHFVLRDVAQFSKDIKDSISILWKAKRTCNIHLMLSSGKDRLGYGVFYSSNVLIFYDDKNYTRHKTFPGTIAFPYHGNKCIENILEKHQHHEVDVEVLYKMITPLHESGDTINVAMDLTTQVIYFAYAEYPTGFVAYKRPHFELKMKPFFTGETDDS